MSEHFPQRKIVVLGIDGVDPSLLSRWMDEGKLPNFSYFRDAGTYSSLQTVMPPQSPVVWASFATGLYPARHGLFDFIQKKDSSYNLELVFSKNEKRLLKSKTIWDLLAEYHIPTSVLFFPDTFPPTKVHGNLISGMGVPDILGTEGAFTFFSTKPRQLDSKRRGRFVSIKDGSRILTKIPGPKYMYFQDVKTSEIPLEIRKDSNRRVVTLLLQDQHIVLAESSFSGWLKVEFQIDFFTKKRGIVQFYLRQVAPEVELYMSPINFDPESPIFPLSYPRNFSESLRKEHGLFSTLGLPHDTWALEEDILSEEAFLIQSESIFKERSRIYFSELDRTRNGVLFGYFGMIDTISHMFWRYLSDQESSHRSTIFDYYKKMDDLVGETRKKLTKDDVLIIISDHGFASFDYEINMNTWLAEHGYLVLKSKRTVGRELLIDVDWSKTKAYAIGYNGIYINVLDREANGIVPAAKKEEVEQALRQELGLFRNPFTNEIVFKNIYTREEMGVRDEYLSPDLFLGYFSGARSSWDTAVGAVPKEIVVQRTSKWSGDHLFDASEVPGIILSNKIISSESPRIIDIAPSIMHLLSLPQKIPFDGKNIFE